MKRCTKKIVPKHKSPHSVHLIADFDSPLRIEEPRAVRKILLEAARAANNTPLKFSIHKFPVQGITGVVILAESHIAIHTWPEYGYVAVDIFTCGKDSKPYKALDYLKECFNPKEVRARLIKRGIE